MLLVLEGQERRAPLGSAAALAPSVQETIMNNTRLCWRAVNCRAFAAAVLLTGTLSQSLLASEIDPAARGTLSVVFENGGLSRSGAAAGWVST